MTIIFRSDRQTEKINRVEREHATYELENKIGDIF